jgi:CRISPR-associated protein Csx10
MNIKLVFSLKFLSEYHTASGISWGKMVDSALLRDSNGQPFIRGATLAGLFRTAARELLVSFSNPLEILEDIFGSPVQQKPWAFSNARLLTKVSTSTLDGKEFARVKRGVRINPLLRKAEDKKIFAKEYGVANLEFVFKVEQRCRHVAEMDQVALLVVAARIIRGIGGSVNRGAGRCLISLLDVEGVPGLDQDKILMHYGRFLKDNKRPRQFTATKPCQINIADHQETSKMLVVAESLEPLILSTTNLGGNEYQSISYINGTALLGAFAAKYIYYFGLQDYDEFLGIFKRGKVTFSPLYPAKKIDNQVLPGIPIPQDFLTCKRKPFFIKQAHYLNGKKYLYAYANKKIPHTCEACKDDAPLVNAQGYLALTEGNYTLYNPLFSFCPHVGMREDERRAAKGQLFSYQAMNEGQFFVGELGFKDRASLEKILSLGHKTDEGWSITLRIGKGNTRGYGQVRLLLKPVSESCLNPWPIAARVKDSQNITLTFLSDSIICDPWGRSVSRFTPAVLSELIGLKVERINNIFVRTKEIRGFSGITGLPAFVDLAVKAGSALGFSLAPEVTLDECRRLLGNLEESGLGFRSQEGFGRVAFNHAVYQLFNPERKFPTILIPEPWDDRVSVNRLLETLEYHLQKRFLGKKLPLSKEVAQRNRQIARWLYSQAYLDVEKLIELARSFGQNNVMAQFGIPDRAKDSKIWNGFGEMLAQRIIEVHSLMGEVLKKTPARGKELTRVTWPFCVRWMAERIIIDAEGRRSDD